MRLEVTDCRDNKAAAAQDSIITAKYTHERQLTSIICDADIVTIGVTMRTLEYKYEEYLKTLSPDMAQRVREAVGEALN